MPPAPGPETSVQADRRVSDEHAMLSLLLPLTGDSAEIGADLWNAAVLALFDSGRDDVVLMPYDTRGTPEGAVAAAEMAVKNGSNGIIGPLFSSSVTAVRPILAGSDTRGIALSNNRAVAGAPFFLIGNHPETQVDALASYLAAADRKRIVLFGPDTPYLQLLRERLTLLDREGRISLAATRLYRTTSSYTEIANEVRAVTLYDRRATALKEFTAIFSEAWQSHEDPEAALQTALDRLSRKVERAQTILAASPGAGVWGVSAADYEQARSDLLQLYQKQIRAKRAPYHAMAEAIAEFQLRETLGTTNFDAVLLPIGDKPLLVIAPMFEYFNASQPEVWLLGTDVWESTARQLPKDLQGGRFVTSTSPHLESFKERFTTAFGNAPHFLAPAAYDAVRVAIAEKQESGNLSFDEAFLTRQAGFDGVNGRFRFLPTGANERTLQIVELRRGEMANVFTWQPDHEMAAPLPTGTEPSPPTGPAAPPAQPVPPVSSISSVRMGNG
jgi:ABC-type branched-subunit amino acid transport system substrate-binding protein